MGSSVCAGVWITKNTKEREMATSPFVSFVAFALSWSRSWFRSWIASVPSQIARKAKCCYNALVRRSLRVVVGTGKILASAPCELAGIDSMRELRRSRNHE
jgi:hypothetical protein